MSICLHLALCSTYPDTTGLKISLSEILAGIVSADAKESSGLASTGEIPKPYVL